MGVIRRRTYAFSVSVLALCLPGVSYAQSGLASSETFPSQDAQPDPGSDGDIIVTSQRRSESIQSVPLSVQAFSAAALQDRGVRSAQDLAQFTPNVAISSPMGPGGQPNVTIRGVGLNDFNTNNAGPNGVYVDEFYVSAPSAQGTSFFDIARVEILKGPQGTLYGRNTSGGAVNVVTAAPTRDMSGYARASYGSYNSVDVEAAIGGPLTSTLSARVSGLYDYSDGFMYNRFLGVRQNGTNNLGLRTQLLWEPNSRLKVLLKGQITDLETRPIGYKAFGTLDPNTGAVCAATDVFANNCVDLFGYAGSDSFYVTDSNRTQKTTMRDILSTLRVEYDLDSVQLTSVSGYNYNSRFFPDNTDSNPYRSIEIDFGSKSWEVTQELRLSQEREQYNWVGGVYYLQEILKQDQPLRLLLDLDDLIGPGGADGISGIQSTANRQLTRSLAAFGQFEWLATEKLRLIAGGRYTWERKDFSTLSYQQLQLGGKDNFGPIQDTVATDDYLIGRRFNFKVAANYRFTPDVMAFANIATGYKAGGFNGGFLSNDPDVRLLQLRPIKPETVTSYEVGLKSQFLDRTVTFNISGFYNDYRNQQISLLVPNPVENQPSFFALDNAPRARTFGIDSDVTVRPTKNLTLSAQLGLLNAKLLEFISTRDVNQPDYSGNRLAQAPSTSLTLAIDYTLPVAANELKLHYDNNYRSSQFFEASNSPYTEHPEYWLHNARISFEMANGVELGAYARNFTGTKYLIFMSNLTDPFGMLQSVVGAPRTFGVDLNIPLAGSGR